MIILACLFVITMKNFTNHENPFHKVVYFLLAVSQLGCIAGAVGAFRMRHFVALCAICTWHTAFPIPVGVDC